MAGTATILVNLHHVIYIHAVNLTYLATEKGVPANSAEKYFESQLGVGHLNTGSERVSRRARRPDG